MEPYKSSIATHLAWNLSQLDSERAERKAVTAEDKADRLFMGWIL
jgi:hypothetical protein